MKFFRTITVFLVFSCGTGLATAQKTLTLGGMGTLKGPATQWGIATKRGIQLAIDDVMADGGLRIGGATYKLNLKMQNDNYTFKGGVTAARRLMADGVNFIIGPLGSPPALGAISVTKGRGVLMLTDGFSPKIMQPDSKMHFRITMTTTEFAPPLIHKLSELYPDAKKVALITTNDETGQQISPLLADVYENTGFDVVMDEHFKRGASDFTSILTRVVASDVDVIELDSDSPEVAAQITKQAHQLGYRGVIMQTGGPAFNDVLNILGSDANGYLTFAIWNHDNPRPKMKNFVKSYHNEYSGSINTYTPIMYNAAQILFEAMRRADSIDPTKVRDSMEKLEGYKTLLGPVKWSGEKEYGIKHQLLFPILFVRLNHGRTQMVERVSQ